MKELKRVKSTMLQKSYKTHKQKRDYVEKEERSDFQRYLRDSKKWQQNILYIGIASAMILMGIFVYLVVNGGF